MLKRLVFVAAMVACLLPAQASAQQDEQATLYDKGHFKGRNITLEGPTRLQTPFAARSIKIPQGKAWELCSGNTFTGCKEFNASDEAMIINVRSARPVAPGLRRRSGRSEAARGLRYAAFRANISSLRMLAATAFTSQAASPRKRPGWPRISAEHAAGAPRPMNAFSRSPGRPISPTCSAPTAAGRLRKSRRLQSL